MDLIGGVYYYNAVLDTLYDFSHELKKVIPNLNDVFNIYKDNSGAFWYNTQLGLLKMTLTSSAMDQYFIESNDACRGYCSFRGITENDDGDLFASFYSGIFHFDPNNNEVKTILQNPINKLPLPSDLFADQNGIWLNNGMYYDLKKKNITQISGSKNIGSEEGFFCLDNEDRLWWTYLNELYYLSDSGNHKKWKKELQLISNEVHQTEALKSSNFGNNLLISCNGRLLIYTPSTGTQKWIAPKDYGLSVKRILAIEDAADNKLWLATDVGLVYLDVAADTARLFSMKDGLSNNFVCGMLAEGDSCLWLSTTNGLSRFNKNSENFTNFYEEDGLTHNEFNRKSYFKASDGKMYFGGLKGITSFYPDQLIQERLRRKNASHVALTSLEYVNEKQDSTIQNNQFFGATHHSYLSLASFVYF